QTNRTPGGTFLVGSSGAGLGVMKKATFFVSSRTSVAASPEGCTEVTSNQSCTLNLVVPLPTNCVALVPRVSVAPPVFVGGTTWFEKLTFSVSGLNCTVTLLDGSSSPEGFSSRSSAFAIGT